MPNVFPVPASTSNEADAFFQLKMKVAFDSFPELSLGELGVIFDSWRLVDRNGVAPGEDGWEPTYNMNAAAAEGWRVKAGKVSDQFRVQGDSQMFAREQVHRHCKAMADIYEKRANGQGFASIRSQGNLVIDRGTVAAFDLYRSAVN